MYCKPWGHLKRAEKSLASICLESTDDGKHLREQNWKFDSLLSYWWTTTPFLSQLNPTVYRRVLLQGGNCCGWIRFLLVFLSIHWFSQEYRPKQTNKQGDKGGKKACEINQVSETVWCHLKKLSSKPHSMQAPTVNPDCSKLRHKAAFIFLQNTNERLARTCELVKEESHFPQLSKAAILVNE